MGFMAFALIVCIVNVLIVAWAFIHWPEQNALAECTIPTTQEVSYPKEEAQPFSTRPEVILTPEQRAMVERVVFAEIGIGTLEEQKAVAQTIHNRVVLWGMTVEDVLTAPKQFASPSTKEIPPITKVAVSEVFDFGMMPYESNVTSFYNYHLCSPSWADNMIEVGKDRYHRFMVKREEIE